MKELITDAQFKELLAELNEPIHISLTLARANPVREAIEKQKKSGKIAMTTNITTLRQL